MKTFLDGGIIILLRMQFFRLSRGTGRYNLGEKLRQATLWIITAPLFPLYAKIVAFLDIFQGL